MPANSYPMNRKRRYRNSPSLLFTRWTRKSYAIFASLGRVVHIGRLSTDLCDSSLRKSGCSLRKNSHQSAIDGADSDTLGEREEPDRSVVALLPSVLVSLVTVSTDCHPVGPRFLPPLQPNSGNFLSDWVSSPQFGITSFFSLINLYVRPFWAVTAVTIRHFGPRTVACYCKY